MIKDCMLMEIRLIVNVLHKCTGDVWEEKIVE